MKKSGYINILILFLLGIGFSALWMWQLTLSWEKKLDQIWPAGLWDLPTQIYSDFTTLKKGAAVEVSSLRQLLDKLHYREVRDLPKEPGEYSWISSPEKKLSLVMQDSVDSSPATKGAPIEISFDEDNSISDILRLPATGLDSITLEPLLLGRFYSLHPEERKIVKLSEIPPYILYAVIGIEDQRFLTHQGVDPKGITRAFLNNIKAGGITQGGSTITQQLARNLFLSPKKSLSRKIKEIIIAVLLENKLSKDEILEAYLNEVYLGQEGPVEIHGVAQAARFYFSKDLRQLNLAESALIAALIKGPNSYSPFRHPETALKRRNLVLQKMKELNLIVRQEYEEAVRQPLRLDKGYIPHEKAPYFLRLVKEKLEELYGETTLSSSGFKVITTLNPFYQQAAESVLERFLSQKRGSHPSLQGVLIAVDPRTGFIQALIGGENYGRSQFNRATQARRSLGSLFKPFVYAAALESKNFTLATQLQDQPTTFNYEGQTWEPRNFDHTWQGPVMARYALEHSLNIPTASLGWQAGLKKITILSAQCGMKIFSSVPSILLGSQEVSPLQAISAYTIFADQGLYHPPVLIKEIHQLVDSSHSGESKKIFMPSSPATTVLSPTTAYLVTSALQGVVARGTARQLGLHFPGTPLAGKTGTTSLERDVWFVGFTPNFLALCWVGFDKEAPLGVQASQMALPLWEAYFKELPYKPSVQEFLPPAGLRRAAIDPKSGGLARHQCPEIYDEIFIEGTEPKQNCPLH